MLTTTGKKFYTIKHGDPEFFHKSDITVIPRASFEISQDCPVNYLRIIQECYNRGWIKPVAHVSDREMMWSKLGG